MSTHWTEAQLEALLELEGDGSQRLLTPAELREMQEQDRPAVTKGCICPHNHEPFTVNGETIICTSPQCQLHGCRSRFIPRSRLTQFDCRTPGVVHGRKAS